MSSQQGLLRRRNRYHLNVKVPLDLREAFGKTHIRASLGTSDFHVACYNVAIERAHVMMLFKEERRKIAAATAPHGEARKTVRTVLSKAEAFELAVRYLVSREHVCEKWMEEEGRFLEQHQRDEMACNVSADADAVATGYEFKGRPLDGTDELQVFLKEENIECAVTSPAFKMLRPLIRDAHIEHLARHEDVLKGRQIQERNPLFKGVNAYSPTVAEVAKGPTLDDLLERRERAIRDMKLCEKTLDVYNALGGLLRDVLGGERLLSTITPDDIRKFFDLLKRVPPNATKRYPKMTLAQAAEAAEKAGDTQRLRPKTLKNHHTNITALFKFAVEERLMETNPAGTRSLRRAFGENVTTEPRQQFTIAELNRLFSSPLHADCQTDLAARQGRFWVPLLALFHGFRCNEVGQIHTEDVKVWEGINYIAVREEREDGSKSEKKLKTKQSKREVPLHPELEKLGFLEFVESRRRDASSPRLFPELTLGHQGYTSDAFSKWFKRFVKKTLGDGCRATMHSFRHMFRVATRAARLPSESVELLGGWGQEQGSASRQLSHYGRGLQNLPTLAKDIAKVEYPGLDLSRLYVIGMEEPKPSPVGLRED